MSHTSKKYKISRIYIFLCIIINNGILTNESIADDYFNIHALDKRANQGTANIENLSVFSSKTGQKPAKYDVKVFFNREEIGLMNINFILSDENKLVPEITKKQLIEWGLKPDFSNNFSALNDNDIILNIGKYIPDANYNFNFNKLKLNINIPQVAVNQSSVGYLSPEKWEDGISAIMLSYQFSASHYKNKNGKNSESQFLNLQNGINLFSWQLRNYSTYTRTNDTSKWSSINTYLQRSITSLKSQLTLGENSTSNQLFDSFQFKGVQLTSDESMLPLNMRGFAPVVKGIAKSNAKVIIKQNNYIIYETYISAGPFEINDLYPTSTNGNLDVIIEEEDGSEQKFVVPFSTVPLLQREGQLKYSLTAGKYSSNDKLSNNPNFAQGTFSYGLPSNITIYSGGITSSNYYSGLLGLGFNLGNLGALSFDAASASTTFRDNKAKYKGESYRLQYAKNLLSTGTTVSLANYRFSSKGYYDFSEANSGERIEGIYNKRSRLQVSLNQTLDEYGSLYLSAYRQNYWNQKGTEENIILGYNNTFDSISYNLGYSYINSTNNTKSDQVASLNIGIPFSLFDNSARATVSYMQDRSGNNTTFIGVNGNALDNALNYNIQQGYYSNNSIANTNLAMSYRSPYGTANTGYNYSNDSSRIYYGIQGGAILHSEGLTLSQSLGETMVLAKVPNAEGVSIHNHTNIKTNSQGYAIVPYLTPYQKNTISLDVTTLDPNVEVQNNTVVAIPKRGAVVFKEFETFAGYRILFTLKHNAFPIPFGTVASLQTTKNQSKDISTGIVGYNGEVYMSGMPENGKILIKWGEQTDQKCIANYHITPNKETPIYHQTIECI